MPLPRPMATLLPTDAAGAPSFGADAPPDFRFRLACSDRACALPPPRDLLRCKALRMLTDPECPLGRAANQ